MIVGSARHHPHPFLLDSVGHGRSIGDDLVGVGGELRSGGLLEADGLGSHLAHDGTALGIGENGFVDVCAKSLPTEDQAAPWPPQCLVGGGGDDVSVGNRVGIRLARHQTGEVSRVHHEYGTDLVCDLAESLVVERPAVGRVTRQENLGPMLLGELFDLVHVDHLGDGIDAVGNKVVVKPRKVDWGAVS